MASSNRIPSVPRRARIAAANDRAANAAGRTALEQLAALDARLGDGVGAVRERVRLAKLI